MKPSRFTEEQIIGILREHHAGFIDIEQMERRGPSRSAALVSHCSRV